jgi:hypothetical protein
MAQHSKGMATFTSHASVATSLHFSPVSSPPRHYLYLHAVLNAGRTPALVDTGCTLTWLRFCYSEAYIYGPSLYLFHVPLLAPAGWPPLVVICEMKKRTKVT